jgi:hypothetical protein
MREVSPTLLEALRKTLSAVEQALDLRADDPGLRELKNTLVRRIGELEVKRTDAISPTIPKDLPDVSSSQYTASKP